MITSDEINNQRFSFTLAQNELHKLKYLFNILDYEPNADEYFMNLVKFKDGGCIRAISNSIYVMLDINIPMKEGSTNMCNFWCNYEKSRGYKNLKSIRNICGPWRNVSTYNETAGQREIIQSIVNLKDNELIDYDYVLSFMKNIFHLNFSIIKTGWKNTDAEMLECEYFKNMINTFETHVHHKIKETIYNAIIIHKFKKFIKKYIVKHSWKNWLEHWYNPDNKDGFIKRFSLKTEYLYL